MKHNGWTFLCVLIIIGTVILAWTKRPWPSDESKEALRQALHALAEAERAAEVADDLLARAPGGHR